MGKKKWTDDKAEDLSTQIYLFAEVASSLQDLNSVVQKAMCEPTCDISMDIISQLTVAIRSGSELLQTLVSVKQMRESNRKLEEAREAYLRGAK